MLALLWIGCNVATLKPHSQAKVSQRLSRGTRHTFHLDAHKRERIEDRHQDEHDAAAHLVPSMCEAQLRLVTSCSGLIKGTNRVRRKNIDPSKVSSLWRCATITTARRHGDFWRGCATVKRCEPHHVCGDVREGVRDQQREKKKRPHLEVHRRK